MRPSISDCFDLLPFFAKSTTPTVRRTMEVEKSGYRTWQWKWPVVWSKNAISTVGPPKRDMKRLSEKTTITKKTALLIVVYTGQAVYRVVYLGMKV